MKKAKREVSLATDHLGEFDPGRVQEHNKEMRAKANPRVGRMMDQVQAALDAENAQMDAQFYAEAQLRAWAKSLLGYPISMTQIDELKEKIKTAEPGKTFNFGSTVLVKTTFGTVDQVDRYLFALERTVVDLSSTSYTGLSFFGLIKLAFKRLFTRSK